MVIKALGQALGGYTCHSKATQHRRAGQRCQVTQSGYPQTHQQIGQVLVARSKDAYIQGRKPGPAVSWRHYEHGLDATRAGVVRAITGGGEASGEEAVGNSDLTPGHPRSPVHHFDHPMRQGSVAAEVPGGAEGSEGQRAWGEHFDGGSQRLHRRHDRLPRSHIPAGFSRYHQQPG
jgi:hypothetical protein